MYTANNSVQSLTSRVRQDSVPEAIMRPDHLRVWNTVLLLPNTFANGKISGNPWIFFQYADDVLPLK